MTKEAVDYNTAVLKTESDNLQGDATFGNLHQVLIEANQTIEAETKPDKLQIKIEAIRKYKTQIKRDFMGLLLRVQMLTESIILQ